MIKNISPYGFIVLLWILGTCQLYGQPEVDRLKNVLKRTTDRKSEVDIFLRLSRISDYPDQSLVYARKALRLSQTLGDLHSTAVCDQEVGRWLFKNKRDSGEFYLNQSIALFELNNNLKGQARSYFYLADGMEKYQQFDSALFFYHKAIQLAEDAVDASGIALYHLELGNLETQRGNIKSALRHVQMANEYYDRPAHMDSAWIAFNSLGVIYNEMGLYPEALEYYLKAYDLVVAHGDQEGMIFLANNLGLIYHELGKLEEAHSYYAKAMEEAHMNGKKYEEAMLLNNLSIIYSEEGDTLKALKTLRRAHDLQVKLDQQCDLAYTCEGLGEAMAWKGRMDSADFYFKKALDWAIRCELVGCQTSIYRSMGVLAKRVRDLPKAEKYLLKSLELGINSHYGAEIKQSAKELYSYYQSTNQTKEALKYHLMFSNIKDSLFNAESTERIARMTAEYDFRRELESLAYEKMRDEMLLNEELKQKQTYQNSILVVLVLTLLLVAAMGRSYYLVQNHNKKLTALNEEKNTLMGVVAHDLRSPLNNIKGLMSLVKMENTNLSPEQSHYFHLLDDTMERMRDMIDRVLDVSVVEDMKVNLNLKKVDLGQAMNFVAGNFELLASKKSIQIHSQIATEKHYILADYNYLLQIIENLLSNAIKFSQSNKNIYLTAEQNDDGEVMVVRDQGPGISEEDLPKLFTKFQKLSAKPTDNEQSTGLGLSIVKKFVDAMDAEISCASELGIGTSFIVRFKVIEDQDLI
ncbi:tetratricopeptide repeat-containing sensor histidine kinase [Reichenbachiella carrageenanivorans]|uniref:histidine kinase n=1 Tax=Reichenbachiella carrageenanivorans TaxID=2979869 RepID=A0ABY6CWC9_9BACT|nr:tetratricopeptide repeat-containing sensor histidine kinase [Reichenbachiella carrageenanivorans]UXX78226.1 tetratricopeptide repeat-containing sensor histidine kinase [Reichenbachiella carrageenanivorans]